MAVTRMINRKSETKYRAFDVVQNGYVSGTLNGLNGGTHHYLIPVIPPLYQGTGSHQRIGQTIMPKKLKVTVDYFFHRQGDSQTLTDQTNASVTLPGIYKVRQFAVSSRRFKSAAAWVDATQQLKTDEQYKLLDVGDGTNSQADTGFVNNNDYPIDSSNFTSHKGNNKTFMMVKNAGFDFDSTATGSTVINGATPYTSAIPFKRKVFFPKLPAKFTYDNDNQQTGYSYPTNWNCLWGAVAQALVPNNPGSSTNSPCLTYEQRLGGMTLVTPAYFKTPIIRCNVRVELWYKDE